MLPENALWTTFRLEGAKPVDSLPAGVCAGLVRRGLVGLALEAGELPNWSLQLENAEAEVATRLAPRRSYKHVRLGR